MGYDVVVRGLDLCDLSGVDAAGDFGEAFASAAGFSFEFLDWVELAAANQLDPPRRYH